MRKGTMRGLILGAVATMVLAMGTANAAVSVTIDNADGSTVLSLPVPPADLAYPPEIVTTVTGTAGFDSLDGSVLYQFSSVDPITSAQVINYSGDAPLSCNETGSECTWSFTVPFILAPGSYTIAVTASEPNIVNPDDPGPSATASIDVTVL